MSHLSTIKCQIKNVNEQVLQEAVEMVVKSLDMGKVSQKVTAWEGYDRPVDCAISSKALPNGIGLNWRSADGLEFVGDSYQFDGEFNRVRKLVIQTYQVLAAKRALAALGYDVQVPQQIGSTVRVVAARA